MGTLEFLIRFREIDNSLDEPNYCHRNSANSTCQYRDQEHDQASTVVTQNEFVDSESSDKNSTNSSGDLLPRHIIWWKLRGLRILVLRVIRGRSWSRPLVRAGIVPTHVSPTGHGVNIFPSGRQSWSWSWLLWRVHNLLKLIVPTCSRNNLPATLSHNYLSGATYNSKNTYEDLLALPVSHFRFIHIYTLR